MAENSGARGTAHRLRAQNVSILIVEDEYLVAMTLENDLTEAGYEVAGIASSADEALHFASTEKPILIVMDIRLSGSRDGIDAALQIYAQTGLRCVFATTNADERSKPAHDAGPSAGLVAKAISPGRAACRLQRCARPAFRSSAPAIAAKRRTSSVRSHRRGSTHANRSALLAEVFNPTSADVRWEPVEGHRVKTYATRESKMSSRKSSENMDAIALLKADHRKVEDLFKKFAKAKDSRTQRVLAQEICTELSVHAQIEEEIFYPATEGEVEDDLRLESYVEHDGAKVLIAEIAQGNPDNEFYDAKMTALCEQIHHHIKEEEKPGEGMFAQARKAGLDMDALGEQLRLRKEEILADIKRNGLPPPETRTFTGHKMRQGKPIEAHLA